MGSQRNRCDGQMTSCCSPHRPCCLTPETLPCQNVLCGKATSPQAAEQPIMRELPNQASDAERVHCHP